MCSTWVDQVVDCGLWNVGPLLFNGCAKLLDIGRNWNTLSYTPCKHAQWVTFPVSMLAMQELGCFQLFYELDPNQLSRDLSLSLSMSLSIPPGHSPIPLFLYVSFYFSFSIAVAPAHSCGLHSLWLIHKHWLNLLTSSHFPLPTRPLRKATAKTTSHLVPYAAIYIHHSEWG